MSSSQFTLAFRGPAVEHGEIDVRDLAPALLAVGDLLQTANTVVNGDLAKVAVRVRATTEGSFEVDLSLFQEIIKSILDFSKENADGIAAAQDLTDLILAAGVPAVGAAAVAGGGLLALLKWLRGRKPDRIEREAGSVYLHIGDKIFVTNDRVIRLAENVSARNHARKLVATLENQGIDSIGTRQHDGHELIIEKDDVPSFDVPDEEATEEKIHDDTRTMTLQIISLSFKEENKWRFTDGGELFTAAIEDENFLRKIANDELSFSKNDYLECRVQEIQMRTKTGLKRERRVVEVMKHSPAAKQLRLL